MAINISPLFFDHFGFIIWLFLCWIAIKDLKNKKLVRLPRITLFFIGFVGIILDGLLLLSFYLEWKLKNFAWMFDYLGIPVFLYVIWLGYSDIKNKEIKKNGLRWTLLIIGILGLIADGFILASYYAR